MPSRAHRRQADCQRGDGAGSHEPVSSSHHVLVNQRPRSETRSEDGRGLDHVCGAAKYGNVDENAASFAGMLSVQSGSWNGAHSAPVGLRKELKIAVRPRSTTSSLSLRPPQPLARAQLNQPAELGFFEGSTTSISGYSTLPSVV